MKETHPSGYSSTIRKRTLARRLVELRKAVDLTTVEVQRQLGWSATKLLWIEKAKWVESVTDGVVDLCELYGVEGRAREELVTLAREGRERGWWIHYSDVLSGKLAGFEAGASVIRTFESALIPGLLQVPGYIEHITRATGIEDPSEVKRHMDARIKRQQILTRKKDPCRLHALVDENAIARITDPGIRHHQFAHLAEISGRRNVDVQILPFAAGVYPSASDPFTCLSFPDPADRDIVYLETNVVDRMLEAYDEVERYRARFEKMRSAALSTDETRAFLKQRIG